MARTNVKVTLRGVKVLHDQLRKMSEFETARRVLFERVKNIWRDGAEAFVRAAMRHILVETGMSAASFFPLSRAIKRPEAVAAVKAAVARAKLSDRALSGRSPRSTYPELPTGERVRGVQGPVTGRKKGEKAFIFNVGRVRRFGFRFSFQTVVFQHAFHEQSQRTLDFGIAAFRRVVERRLRVEANQILQSWATGKKLTSRLRNPRTGNPLPIQVESQESD